MKEEQSSQCEQSRSISEKMMRVSLNGGYKKKAEVSKAKEGALEGTGQMVSAKALGLKWAGCSQKTVKMPDTGESKKQEGEVQEGKLNCTRLVDQVRPDHRAHGQRRLPGDLTDTLQGVLREWEP